MLSTRGRKGQEECPFYVERESSRSSPGQTQVLRVCFKPRSTVRISCKHIPFPFLRIREATKQPSYRFQWHAQAKLEIFVKMGLETQVVWLTGHGIEPKINIIEPIVRFPSVVPFTEVQEATFTVENPSLYPIELFWHHLDE